MVTEDQIIWSVMCHWWQEGYESDPIWSAIRQSDVSLLALPSDLAQAQHALGEAAANVIVFCDVGMDPLTTYLAHARLAPIQLAFWGHPTTTGTERCEITYLLGSYPLTDLTKS